jgi:hypothetical protein
MTRRWPGLWRFVPLGIVFGILIRAGDSASGVVAWVVNIGGPWILLSFLIGAVCTDAGRAVLSSVVALEAAVVAKYATQLGEGAITLHAAVLRAVLWGVAALGVSVVFAFAGARSRRCGRYFLFPAAALSVEAVAFLAGGLRGESAHLRYVGQPAAVAVFGCELAAAGVLVAFAMMSRSSGARPRRPDGVARATEGA